jgi:hypothetical protein
MTFIVHVVGIIFSSVTCFASWIVYLAQVLEEYVYI